MSAVRSMILTGSPTARSRFDCCEGVRSSSKITTSASIRRTRLQSSSTFPDPIYVRGFGRSRRCDMRATVSAPAVSAKRSSSSSDLSTGQPPGRPSTPTSTARSGTGAVETRGKRAMLQSLPLPNERDGAIDPGLVHIDPKDTVITLEPTELPLGVTAGAHLDEINCLSKR